jgi:glycerol-3-phosphate dehydrogenase
MKRNFNGLADTEFDLLIIGGGITGSCIARDAASRGLKVALVEKNDFSSATSAGSSKLVHGGLRYLRNFELGLVRESLAERRIWERIAPHQVRPLAFLLPADKKSKSTLNIGLTLYDLLSFDRNKVKDPEQKLPGHKWLKAEAAKKAEPVVAGQDLEGAFVYYDCQMRSPERLGLECLIDADRHGAVVTNYAEATGFLRDGKHILGAEVFDRVTGNETNVRARITLNAAGPWADSLLGLAQQGEPSRHLLRSKGIHLITRQLTSGHAVMAAIPEEMGGGHMFLLPWRGKTIIGTTDTAYEGDPDELEVTPRETTAYLSVINKTISGIGLTRDDVIHAYAGLRPLIQDKAEKKNPYNASRKSEVVDHQKEDGLKGLFSAIGGKWTTSRHVAEDAVTAIAKRLKRKLPASRTAETPLPGGKFDALSPFFDAMNQRYPELSGARLDELVFTYGSEMDAIATLASESAALAERLAPDRGEIGAQVVHAVREEMAFTLEDVVFRRTGLGTLGYPGDEALARVTQIMARELSWDAAQIEEELRGVKRLFYAERT